MAPSIAQDSLGASSPSSSSTPLDSFHSLISNLSQILGPSSGLDSQDVEVFALRKLMADYTSSESEWCKYAFSDLTRGYTRNLVDEGNGKSNLLVLVWTPGKGSPIHDHANAHCVMKVLKGTLVETQFTTPESSDCAPKIIKETTYQENQITYMADELGLHKISNPSLDEVAVSLHLYTPPNAARYGCNIFNEETGKRSHVTQSNFYSVLGRRMVDGA